MPTIMQPNHAPFKYVHSKVVQYYSCIVDLRWSRSIHSCDVCPYRSQKDGKCNSVHYGICSPVLTVPVKVRTRNKGGRVVSVPVRRISIPIRIQANANKEVATPPDKREVTLVDSWPAQDGEASSFLRQKRDELNQKRQDKLVSKEVPPPSTPLEKANASGDATTVIPVCSPVDVTQVTLAENLSENAAVVSVAKERAVPVSENQDPIVLPGTVKGAQAVDFSPKVPASSATTTTPAVTTSVTATTPVLSTPTVTPQSVSQPPSRPLPQLSSNAAANANLPQFYFPMGQPAANGNGDALMQRVKEEFDKVEGGKVSKTQMGPVVKACGIPFYWKSSLFRYLGGEKSGHITLQGFLAAWKKLTSTCFDAASRFVTILAKPGRNFLEFDDFLPLVQDVVDGHPGLKFLQDAPEFHSRYIQTVISRIFYTVNRSWTGRMTIQELRKSNLLSTIETLEEEDDINQIVDFFSYEHFYVIYCKFWELDTDHDLLISKEDLTRHNDHAISSRMIDRIFSGAVTRNLVDGKLTYRDFVWFLISEEDKRHPRSVEYWFRCMDLNGDGIVSMYEMEYFYEEQVQKMEMLGIETLPFQDCLCQMFDMIQPFEEGKIRLKDLKACSLTPIFFDTFFNLDKYLEHEQKDPFASIRDRDGDEPEMSDWERFAAEEYEMLVAEEGTQSEDLIYEDDFEPEEAESEGTNVEAKPSTATAPLKKAAALRDGSAKKDDIYDFTPNDLGY